MPPGRLSATLTFGWRALLKIKHTPEQVFDLVATPILFTVLFTYMFGGALAGSPQAYLQFLLPERGNRLYVKALRALVGAYLTDADGRPLRLPDEPSFGVESA